MAGRGLSGVLMRGFGVKDHDATVTGVEQLTPKFARVRMTSPTLFDEVEPGPTAWLRFWFPDPDGSGAQHQRGYTLSEADPATGRFAIDVVLHEPAGPASSWARDASPGATVSVSSSGSMTFEVPEEPPRGYLVLGDSASIPAINGIISAVPDTVPLEVYLEEHDPDDHLIPLAGHPRLRAHWVPRRGEESFAAALEARDWSDWTVWGAPESGSLKHLRTRLRDGFGFPKSEIHARAYWYEGRAFGKRRSAADAAEAAGATGTADAPTTEVTTTSAITAVSTSEPPSTAPAEIAVGTTDQSVPPAGAGSAASDPSRAPSAGPARGAEQPSAAPAPSAAPTSTPSPAPSAAQGSWRSRAGGRLLAPLRSRLILAGVVQALVTLLELSPFVLLTELSRRLLSGAGTGDLFRLGVLAVVLMGAGVLLATALMVWAHLVDARFERDLRRRLLGKIAHLPLGWFDRRTSGQVKQLVQDDTLSLHYLVTHAVPDGVKAVVAPAAVLTYLFVVDWRLALVLLLPVLVYVVTMYRMVLQSITRMGQASRWAERMTSEAGGYLEGQPVVRVFGGAAASTFRRRLDGYVRFLGDWQRPFTGQKTLMDLATRPSTFLLLIVLAGTTLITAGWMEAVTLVPFLLLGTTFGARLLGIGFGLSGLRGGLEAARRLQVTLDEPELATLETDGTNTSAGADQADRIGAADGTGGADGAGGADDGSPAASAEVPTGRVEIDHVDFSYRPGLPVLEDVSLILEPHTVTALVGPSGSGKSTLAALLARFHDVTGGAIRIGGRDVRELRADELYTQVGFVFQQTQLVRGTVRENIALARPEASQEQIREAAAAAQIHDRIIALPQGYDTELGPDAALSGGERQRLTIARALLADTPVLVLDEATAFADPESEYLVQRALNRLTAGRTVLVIAHRLHTITEVDRIVVLDEGRVVETGTHQKLLASEGRYRRLWDADGSLRGTSRSGVAPSADRPSGTASSGTAPSGTAPSTSVLADAALEGDPR
ncbi:ABC transporter ATP-binding protein/permease [Brachybacterium tyrofermentans]|uniref:ABC transporter ATP-binding protein/permease n=1 Tax=Brachybacterium tyrofermentans TaxID=47848 RepID=UPI003FD159D0